MDPTKRRAALLLNLEGTVAAVNSGQTFDSMDLFEEDADIASEIPASLNETRTLHQLLREYNVTDVVAAHFDEPAFENLRHDGLLLWLCPPGLSRQDAARAWRDGKLAQAIVPSHPVPAGPPMPVPEHKRHEHAPHRESTVEPPVQGGRMPGV